MERTPLRAIMATPEPHRYTPRKVAWSSPHSFMTTESRTIAILGCRPLDLPNFLPWNRRAQRRCLLGSRVSHQMETLGRLWLGGADLTDGEGEEVAMSLSFRASGAGGPLPSPTGSPGPTGSPPPPSPPPWPSPTGDEGSVPDDMVDHVILVVFDGMRGDYLYGQDPPENENRFNSPNFDRMRTEGACTKNARHDRDSSQTLLNHISLFIGEPVSDHGFEEDSDPGGTIENIIGPQYAGKNIFSLVKARGGKTSFYGNKDKFAIFERSWDLNSGGSRFVCDSPQRRYKSGSDYIGDFVDQMKSNRYQFSFFHARDPDKAGHSGNGEGTSAYTDAVKDCDGYLGELFEMIDDDPMLRQRTAIILTADHGFETGGNHNDEEDPENYKIAFCAWGPGVEAGADLIDLNIGTVSDPENGRGGDDVIRNTYAGVLAADFLGIKTLDGAFSDEYLRVSSQPLPETSAPSNKPTSGPTSRPSTHPSSKPSAASEDPSSSPSNMPSSLPSNVPTMSSGAPSNLPSPNPSVTKSAAPSGAPSRDPSGVPSTVPSLQPSMAPSACKSPTDCEPSTNDCVNNVCMDGDCVLKNKDDGTACSDDNVFTHGDECYDGVCYGSHHPSATPSLSTFPSNAPSVTASAGTGSAKPSSSASEIPTRAASSSPSVTGSDAPSVVPSETPSLEPTSTQSSSPSSSPSESPTGTTSAPTSSPEASPSSSPTTSPETSPTWKEIFFDDFGTGWQGWEDGGDDAKRISNLNNVYSGTHALRIQDDSTSSMVTKEVDMSSYMYNTIKVTFKFKPKRMTDSTERFHFDVSKDGLPFDRVRTWKNQDMDDNRWDEGVADSIAVTNVNILRIRFQCEGTGNKDRVFIDNVKMEGM
mmetsp:Transcript_13039/g.28244  ORF Transcript_13039/g.28244 Transcript_13039/m.28244 type:complete len:869 (-) Transcript_13039:121-2727(-)